MSLRTASASHWHENQRGPQETDTARWQHQLVRGNKRQPQMSGTRPSATPVSARPSPTGSPSAAPSSRRAPSLTASASPKQNVAAPDDRLPAGSAAMGERSLRFQNTQRSLCCLSSLRPCQRLQRVAIGPRARLTQLGGEIESDLLTDPVRDDERGELVGLLAGQLRRTAALLQRRYFSRSHRRICVWEAQN